MNKATHLLKACRTAFISAAVTGKIEVHPFHSAQGTNQGMCGVRPFDCSQGTEVTS